MTNETKWTQGPWVFDPEEHSIMSTTEVWIDEDVEYDIPRMMTEVVHLKGVMGGDNAKADAFLMAAGPELDEALYNILRDYRDAAGDWGSENQDIALELICKAEMALAKARDLTKVQFQRLLSTSSSGQQMRIDYE